MALIASFDIVILLSLFALLLFALTRIGEKTMLSLAAICEFFARMDRNHAFFFEKRALLHRSLTK